MSKSFLFLFCLLFACNLSFTQEKYDLLPFDQVIVLDGHSNEEVWQKTVFSNEFILSKSNQKVRHISRFKSFTNRENLYLLIELKGKELIDIKKQPSTFNEKNRSFSGDQIEILIATKPEVDDHYSILIDFNNKVEDCYVPAKAGHGFPYSPKVDWKWDSKTQCVVSQSDGCILMEVKIPVVSLNLEMNLFRAFGVNIHCRVFFEEGKNNKSEDSYWCNINGEPWNTQFFGLFLGPIYEAPIDFNAKDLENLEQMTNGMTAILKSLDIYFKAVSKYAFHIPEGCEINGGIIQFDHVPIPQYTVKADGYFRFYNALKYEPYKELGENIINKLHKAYSATKDFESHHYLVWNNLSSNDGVVYSYGQGKKMGFYVPGEVPFDQSNNKFCLKEIVFQDAFGQGFLDLSEIKDSLSLTAQSQIIEMLNGTLVFLHKPYVLVNKNDQYFWRIDAFEPSNPKPFAGVLKNEDWPFLGQDIISMYMALYQFDKAKSSPFLDSMVKFSNFYISGRLKISKYFGPHDPHNILKLDTRMLLLARFATENNLVELAFLNSWLQSELPKIYAEIPKVEFSDNGATSNSWSTQGVFEIYRLLGLKSNYETFWHKSFETKMKPLGLYLGNRILPMNFSSYPLYFDYANKGYHSQIMAEDTYKQTVKKMFILYGNSKLHRNNILYACDLTPEQRTRPLWVNTPYECYIEGVLPEGIDVNSIKFPVSFESTDGIKIYRRSPEFSITVTVDIKPFGFGAGLEANLGFRFEVPISETSRFTTDLVILSLYGPGALETIPNSLKSKIAGAVGLVTGVDQDVVKFFPNCGFSAGGNNVVIDGGANGLPFQSKVAGDEKIKIYVGGVLVKSY